MLGRREVDEQNVAFREHSPPECVGSLGKCRAQRRVLGRSPPRSFPTPGLPTVLSNCSVFFLLLLFYKGARLSLSVTAFSFVGTW